MSGKLQRFVQPLYKSGYILLTLHLHLLVRTIIDSSLTFRPFQPIWVKTFLGKMRICGAKGLDVRDESVTVHTSRGRQATE